MVKDSRLTKKRFSSAGDFLPYYFKTITGRVGISNIHYLNFPSDKQRDSEGFQETNAHTDYAYYSGSFV